MQKKPNKINHKEQRAVAGNWGRPADHEHKVRIPEQPEIGKRAADKKYKSKKPPIALHHCPFCLKERIIVVSKELADKLWVFINPNGSRVYTRYVWGGVRAKKCSCGAREFRKGCPCCKRDSWALNGVYKHENGGCGFTGKKKLNGSDDA